MSEEKTTQKQSLFKKITNGISALGDAILSNYTLSEEKATELATQALETASTKSAETVVAVDTAMQRVITSDGTDQIHMPLNTVRITAEDRTSYTEDPEAAIQDITTKLQENSNNSFLHRIAQISESSKSPCSIMTMESPFNHKLR
jgi:hypothetical protein